MATAIAQLKPIVSALIYGMYRTIDLLCLVAKLLIALRDDMWPDL